MVIFLEKFLAHAAIWMVVSESRPELAFSVLFPADVLPVLAAGNFLQASHHGFQKRNSKILPMKHSLVGNICVCFYFACAFIPFGTCEVLKLNSCSLNFLITIYRFAFRPSSGKKKSPAHG